MLSRQTKIHMEDQPVIGFFLAQLHYLVALFILENGKEECAMDKANKNGLTVADTKVNGHMIKPTATGNYTMLTETSMKEIGWTIKQTEEVYILMLTVLNIMVNGKMISNMVLVLRHGLMVQYMKANTTKERKMVEES